MNMWRCTAWRIGIFLFIGVIIVPYGIAQSIDDLFLDESFSDSEQDTPSVESPNASDDAIQRIVIPTIPVQLSVPSVSVLFGITDEYAHTLYQRDDTVLNPDRLQYTSPLTNILTLDSRVRYKNAARWFSFEVDNRVFFELKDEKDKSDPWEVDTFHGNELKSASIGVSLFDDIVSFRLGKILSAQSVGFLKTPSDPLYRAYGNSVAWASNKEFETVSTRDFSIEPLERGSGSSVSGEGNSNTARIGSWMTDATLLLPWFSLRQAYLPKLETGFEEFDRPYHSSLTSISLIMFPQVTPTLTFFYDNVPFVGVAMSSNIGDYVTLYLDSSVSFKNELPVPKADGSQPLSPTTSLDHYTVESYKKDGTYFEGLLGTSITPSFEGETLFSMLFEVYYNGKGLVNDEWDDYKDVLQDIHTNYKNFSQNEQIQNLYKGILSVPLQYYNPIRVRPLYLTLRISRDNIFQKIWTEQFDISSSLVYSVFDTTFSWSTNFDWIGKNFLKTGISFDYYFGSPNGAFTELTNAFTISVYTSLTFSKN